MDITRRDALWGAAAAAVVTVAITAPLAVKSARVKAALAGDRAMGLAQQLREGVQALVDEIRQDLGGQVVMGSYWALQQAADRLEALPGIEALPSQYWTAEYQDCARRHGLAQILRRVPS